MILCRNRPGDVCGREAKQHADNETNNDTDGHVVDAYTWQEPVVSIGRHIGDVSCGGVSAALSTKKRMALLPRARGAGCKTLK